MCEMDDAGVIRGGLGGRRFGEVREFVISLFWNFKGVL